MLLLAAPSGGQSLKGRGRPSRRRDIWIRLTSRSAVLALAATMSACTSNGSGTSTSPSEDGGPNATTCTQPLPSFEGVGGCPYLFDDKVTWRDEICPLAPGTGVFEQSCPGYLLREFHIGTRLRRCYYETRYRDLQAAYVVDDAKTYCDGTSKTVFYGISQYDDGCDKPLFKLSDPCSPGNSSGAVCTDPKASAPASPPCPDGWYFYDDSACGPPDASGHQTCERRGDQRCYQPCGIDADCCSLVCFGLTVFEGSDYSQLKYVCQ